MNTKRIIIIGVATALAAAGGCTEAKPRKSEVIERATLNEPVLTSIAVEAPPAPVPLEVDSQLPVDEARVPGTPESRTFGAVVESKDGVVIQRMLTAPAIENREPVAALSIFGHHDEKVYAFVEVSNESETDQTLLVHFVGPDGQVSGGIELRIPANAPRWRTWAYTRHAKDPGLWRVELRTLEGALLGALPFEVEPGC